MTRTPNQKLADKLDLQLHRIISRVEDAIADGRGEDRRKWSEARFALSTARGHVRSMMNDDDRKATL